MKFRRLALLLSLALCLCITLCVTGTVARADCSHRVLCTNMNHCDMCGDEVTEAAEVWHYALCTTDDPTTCACGESDEFKIDHLDPQYDYVFYSDTQCAKMCLACNEPWEVQEHWNYCDNDTTVCYSCGATDVTIEPSHSWYNNPYEHDDTTHWEVCADCDQPIGEPEPHHGRCDGYCYACRATGVTITEENVDYHTGDSEYRSVDETSHVYSCSTCGAAKRDPEPHVVYCDSTEQTCGVCGATDVVVDGVGHKNTQYGSDETYCNVLFCLSCGEMVSKWPSYHYARCTSPTECAYCDMADVTIREVIHFDNEYGYNDTHHFTKCNACGEVYDEEPHFGDCADPTTCTNYGCGATGITISPEELYHYEHEYEYEYDDTSHWAVCTCCGALVGGKKEHYTFCEDPDACDVCGATDVMLEYYGHIWRGDVDTYWTHDDTTHWEHCPTCDAVLDSGDHRGSCVNPNICGICDAEGVTLKGISHEYTMMYVDRDYCQYTCERCGDTPYEPEIHHVRCYDDTHCTLCGGDNVNPDTAYMGHDYSNDYDSYDEKMHYQTCTYCGAQTESEHFVNCSGSAKLADYEGCTGCGAPMSEIVVDRVTHWHQDSYGYDYDDTFHWCYCSGGCGERMSTGYHYNYCYNDTSMCIACDATDVSINVYHQEECTEVTAEYCVWFCSACGQRDEQEHWGYCTSPNTCYYCETENLKIPAEQWTHQGTFTPGASGCDFACSYCDYEKTREHVFIDGVCGYCGAEESKRVPGDANEDGRADTLDALLILQHMSGYGVSINLSNADCNADGRADTMDALLILQHMSGYDVELK